MKRLFLASVAANIIEKLIEIIPKPPNQTKVAFVPTAADPYDYKWFLNDDLLKLKEKGFTVREVDIKNKTKQELLNELKNIDIIFVAGGNTFYLLEKFRENGFDKLVKEFIQKGVIYVGSSAGATLAGPTIEPVKVFDDPAQAPSLKSFEGLSLVDFVILPHFNSDDEVNRPKYEKIINEYTKKRHKIIALTDNQAILAEGDHYKMVEK